MLSLLPLQYARNIGGYGPHGQPMVKPMIHNWIFRRSHTCRTKDEFAVFKQKKFASGVFKTEFMSFLDKNKKWMPSHLWSSHL